MAQVFLKYRWFGGDLPSPWGMQVNVRLNILVVGMAFDALTSSCRPTIVKTRTASCKYTNKISSSDPMKCELVHS